MRVILLSIAFLFIAFSAQSQVLKSAGVWYFLDVDSMTARPAVLPNGTELAYVVGTKTVYYWNRNTSTWMAYGSTFSRDSIYFDASIVGSGTVSDPWGVDSTLFATIAGVGDSIAAALGDYLPILGGRLTGTGGNGFVGFPLQSSPPATPATGFSLYAGSTGNNISWMQPDGFFRRLVSPVTGTPRQYQFMARSYTLADSADVSNNITSIAANYLATSNGTNLVARNLFDNNTYVGILNSKPFSLGQWTTAGRPTGVNNYWGYNSTTDWLEGYLTSAGAWISPLQSSLTGGKGTATRILYNDANGRATDNSGLAFSGTNLLLQYGNGISFHSSYRANNGSYAIHAHSGGDFRFVGSSDNTTYRHFSFGYYTADNPTSTWNQRFAVNSFTGGVGIGTAPGGHVMLPVFGTVASTALGTFANGFSIWMRTTVNATANNHILIGSHINPILNTAGYSGVLRYGMVVDDYNNIFNRVTGSTGIGMSGGAGNDIDASAKFEIRSTSLGFLPPRMPQSNRTSIPSPATGLEAFQTDGTEGMYVKLAAGWKKYLVEGEGGDGNGIISALPLGNVDIKTSNQLNLKTSGGATGTNFYTGGLTLLKTATGTTGGQIYLADTTGNLDFAYGLVQDDRTVIQNGGTGRQVTQLLTDYNPTINFRWVNGVRLDTTSSVHVMRIMWGDKNTNETFPTEFIFNAAMPVGSTASAYNFKTAHSTGRLSLNFDNGIYLKKDRKFFLEADSTFAYSFTDNTLRLSSYGIGAKEASDLSKTQSNYIAGFATDGTILDLEQKRDTTIYVTDADYNFSAAITSANILKRYNRILIYSKLTSGASSDNQIILHSASSDFLQVEIIIYSNDASADADETSIDFTTNGAVDGAGGTVSTYGMAAGERINIRAVDDGGYKWIFN